MSSKPRSKDAIRAELNRWEEELDRHIDECVCCEEDPEDFCPHGSRIHNIRFVLLIEMMVAEGKRMQEVKEARRRRRAEKKRRPVPVPPARQATAGAEKVSG
jgi:hypothetical protein